ncbi:MAG TPA: hypothetical protein VEI27_01675 [Dehalococcoidales bacterium]|nr:hypothetical protein [Dehalococcoidales bacterium]
MAMKKKLLFFGVALVLVVLTAVTFARPTSSSTVTITAASSGDVSTVQSVGGSGTSGVANTVALQYATGSSAPFTQVSPAWSPAKNASGSITSGDVYYADVTNYTGDVRVNIYLTNSGALSKDYSYLNMKVNVWAGASGAWLQATNVGSGDDANDYLTLNNGVVSFVLAGGTHYDISIDGGSFFCADTTVDSTHSLSPDFYVETKAF